MAGPHVTNEKRKRRFAAVGVYGRLVLNPCVDPQKELLRRNVVSAITRECMWYVWHPQNHLLDNGPTALPDTTNENHLLIILKKVGYCFKLCKNEYSNIMRIKLIGLARMIEK